MHHRISTQTNAGLLDALEVKVPKPSTVENVDEKNEFKSLMEKAGVRHQVRLASGSRGRGLFPTGPVGWTDSAMLLSVPLDVCICAPFGDEDAVANELGLNDGYKDTCTILRRAWQKRNGAKVPEAIVSLLDSDSGDDRELALALWVLWATEEGGEVWEAYAQWLPKPDGSMPSLLLADDKELAQLQDDVLAAEARQIHEAMAAAHKKIALANADAKAMKGRTCREFTLDELKWGFALVASRAVASPVGDGASAAAIMVPFFDMANHDDRGYVSAIKSVRGTEDGDVENGIRVAVERAINQGVGGPRVVLETTRGLQNTDDEIVIQYDPDAANNELVLRYGFSLRGNRNEKAAAAGRWLTRRHVRAHRRRVQAGARGEGSDAGDDAARGPAKVNLGGRQRVSRPGYPRGGRRLGTGRGRVREGGDGRVGAAGALEARAGLVRDERGGG